MSTEQETIEVWVWATDQNVVMCRPVMDPDYWGPPIMTEGYRKIVITKGKFDSDVK